MRFPDARAAAPALRGRSRAASALFAAVALVYVVAGLWTTHRISATGDEVTYFMAADSLLRGEGFELTQRWAAVASASYSPGDPIPADEFARTTAPSQTRAGAYPIHDLALPVLIAAPFALGGRGAVVAFIGVAMAAAVALGYRAARGFGVRQGTALLGSLAVATSAPALTYSGQVFADAIAPLAVGAAACALAGAAPRAVFAIALAALPLLHVRYWPIALGLALAALVLWRPGPREIARLVAPTAIGAALYAMFDFALYGLALPHAGFLLFFSQRAAPIETYGGIAGIAGLFVDRAFGLLPAAPLALLLFAGAGRALRRPRERALILAVVPYLVVVPLVDWTGGYSPQARYLAPLVPLFPLLYARAVAGALARMTAGPLALWTLGQSAIFVVAPWLRYDAFGIAPLADRAWSAVLGITPSAVFPQLGTDGAAVPAMLWTGALIALVAWSYASEPPQYSPSVAKPGQTSAG